MVSGGDAGDLQCVDVVGLGAGAAPAAVICGGCGCPKWCRGWSGGMFGFSRAIRSTSRRFSTVVCGRPAGRVGWVQWRAMRRRCQRNKVSGVTSQPARCRRGKAAATAPSRARSSSASAGRSVCRLRTVSWWRNTMISRPFARPERTAKRANDTSNRYRTRHIGPQDRERRTRSARHDHMSATHRHPRCSPSCLVSAHDRIFGHPHSELVLCRIRSGAI